jgi:hypothetical protein
MNHWWPPVCTYIGNTSRVISGSDFGIIETNQINIFHICIFTIDCIMYIGLSDLAEISRPVVYVHLYIKGCELTACLPQFRYSNSKVGTQLE